MAGASRTVQLDGGRATEGFAANDIKTAKYNVATFLPKFLWEMFSRAAYLYFLFQVRAAPGMPGALCPALCSSPSMVPTAALCRLIAASAHNLCFPQPPSQWPAAHSATR